MGSWIQPAILKTARRAKISEQCAAIKAHSNEQSGKSYPQRAAGSGRCISPATVSASSYGGETRVPTGPIIIGAYWPRGDCSSEPARAAVLTIVRAAGEVLTVENKTDQEQDFFDLFSFLLWG